MIPLPHWRRLTTIVRKELLVLFSNRVSRIMLIVPPLMQIVMFGWAATLEVRNVDVAILNRDSGPLAAEILHRLRGSATFRHIFFLSSEADMADAIDNGRALFALVLGQDLSRKAAAGEEAVVQVILDGRRANASQIAAYYLQSILADVAATLPRTRPAARQAAGIPHIALHIRCWFNPNLEFQWFFLPNLIGMLSFMLGLVVTGLSVAREREVGTFDQLLVSPATPIEIALAKLLPGCIIGLIHGTIFLLITVFGFGVPFSGSVLLLYAAVLLFALASGGVGLMVSSIAATQQQAFLGAFTVGVPCILLSGAVTPVINMPPFLQIASELNPVRHFTTLAQGVFLKDISLPAALLNLGKISLIALVCILVAVSMFRRKV